MKEKTDNSLPSSRLNQLRLLVALDTLLVEGSVTKAAARMELSVPAMSRLLAQIREVYKDPILVRSGPRLVPTPRAEALRHRLRALAAEADDLLGAVLETPATPDGNPYADWNVPALVEAAPLAMRPQVMLDGQPTPDMHARYLARIGNNADPTVRLSKHIAIIGRGIGNSRPLTLEEADDAFSIIMQGNADPMQISALLQITHYRGLTAPELAGFVQAARKEITALPLSSGQADLDWPAYISPVSPRAPWFLQAAKLVSLAGHRVLVHGNNGYAESSGKLEIAAKTLDIPVCSSIAEASRMLATKHIAFMPVAGFAPQIYRLLELYSLFSARSPVNDIVHMLNPLGASASLLGVSKPAYRELHRDAGQLIAWNNLSVLNSSRDVAEYAPFRSASVYRLVDGVSSEVVLRSVPEPETLPRVGLNSRQYWKAVWTGAAVDPKAEEIIVSTAALGLMTLNAAQSEDFDYWREEARQLWAQRPRD